MEFLTRGDSLYLQDRFFDAAEAYRQAGNEDSGLVPAANAKLALCLMQLGDTAAAEKILDEALRLHPDHSGLKFSKAKSLFYAEDFGAAKEMFLRVEDLPEEAKTRWVRKCETAGGA